jgi:cytochrome c oxidase subunit IV
MAMEQTTEAAAGGATGGHLVPYGTFVAVWAVLLGLTALLVAVSLLKHEMLSVPAMLTITPIKAGLVFYYFMHLKYEPTLLKVMLVVALGALLIFLGLLFTDISFR